MGWRGREGGLAEGRKEIDIDGDREGEREREGRSMIWPYPPLLLSLRSYPSLLRNTFFFFSQKSVPKHF